MSVSVPGEPSVHEDDDGHLPCPGEGCQWGDDDGAGEEFECGLAKLGVPPGTHLDLRCGASLFVDGFPSRLLDVEAGEQPLVIVLCSCDDPRLDRPGGNPHCIHCGDLCPIETDSVSDLVATMAAVAREFPGRPLVVHTGSFADGIHDIPAHGGICWCLPTVVMP